MDEIIRLVGPSRAVEIFGIRLVGINAENGKKLLMSLLLIAMIFLLRWAIRQGSKFIFRRRPDEQTEFWARQTIQLITAFLLLLGLASIWFNDPTRLATALGLVTAGLAFALQRVVTAAAGYFVILRGKTFHVGDRIVMGGVRGDVVALGFMQTTIMEMGQPPSVQAADPAMWVRSREYTGRLVTVSNARIFDEPVYNYTRDFPYIWEELSLPIPYRADRERAERIVTEAALRHTITTNKLGQEALEEMQRRYFLKPTEIGPRVYYRLTDNWLELTVRFIVRDRGIREAKDALSRDILQAFEQAGIELASATFEIVGVPPLRIEKESRIQPAGAFDHT
ncbi:mechanosensitive ion channel family protein [Methylocaldum gracile subsp. desertum]|uniref:mechanosensitive ion channel family protein n=1 Tax=Methylocaldum sp. GT1BW TaxID=3438964 RepID=UPI003DA17599